MPRIPRHDEPDLWHHVMNRGIARRTLFENDNDVRMFLALLAWRVHAGDIELHAFCVMTTHYHLLVRSVTGQLSAALAVVQREYSRWFNRTRQRDGPLCRGRFYSKPVETIEYRINALRYIDFNPVRAGLVATPALFPHGSARCYAEERGPIWLSRDWVEAEVCRARGTERYRPEDYAPCFGEPIPASLARLIETRLVLRDPGEDPLAHLLNAAHGQVAEWMQRKAALADGMPVGMPVCDPDDVAEEIRAAISLWSGWTVNAGRKSVDAWSQVHVALLRDLCGLNWSQIGSRLDLSTSGAWRMYQRHQRNISEVDEYVERTSCLAERSLRRCFKGA